MAQAVDLIAQPLQHRFHGRTQRRPFIGVARVGQLQPQRAEALDGLVVDLPRPPRALALARLHPVTQALDLDRALRHEPLRDARRECVQRLAVGVAEAAVAAQRDHHAAALTLHAQRLDQNGARLETQFVQPCRLLTTRAIQRHRLARTGREPQARCPPLA